MNVIRRHRPSDNRHPSGSARLAYQVAHPLRYPAPENLLPVLRAPNHVVLQVVNRVCALPVFCHPSILGGMRRLEADRLKAVGLNRAVDTKLYIKARELMLSCRGYFAALAKERARNISSLACF